MSSILNALRKLEDGRRQNRLEGGRDPHLFPGRSGVGETVKKRARPVIFGVSGIFIVILLYISFAAGRGAVETDHRPGEGISAERAGTQEQKRESRESSTESSGGMEKKGLAAADSSGKENQKVNKSIVKESEKKSLDSPGLERPVIILPKFEFRKMEEDESLVRIEPRRKSRSNTSGGYDSREKTGDENEGPPVYMGDELLLQAIAWAADPDDCVAVINDHIAKQGDNVAGFSINRIEKNSVIVTRGTETWRMALRAGE